MQRVYIPNNSGHDFSDAESYGELIFITEGLLSKFQVNQMYRKVAEVLKDSNSEDYVLVTGLTQINIISASVFAYLHGKLNLLIYDAKEDEYVSRTIMLSNLLPSPQTIEYNEAIDLIEEAMETENTERWEKLKTIKERLISGVDITLKSKNNQKGEKDERDVNT